MRRLIALIASVATFLLVANAALAFTHFPNASCPDSVTMHQLLSPGTCRPTPGSGAPGDTIYGLGGIITAFDPIASTYAFYLQNNRADSTGYLAGADVFTGSHNYLSAPDNYALGDSVVVEWAGFESYQGSYEVLSPSNSTSSPNIICRKVSSGNRIPDFYVGTTTQLRTNETNSSSIPYLGSLVHINGPLHVARKNVTGTNNFYVVSASAPGDSVYIQGYTLTTYGSPEVGTNIDWVQGVYEHRTSTHYAIWLRDGNDISVSTPPNVNDAYSIADNQIRVLFDRNVETTSATNVANYSLASFGSVDAAVMDGTTNVILTVTNGLNHGDVETVTVNSVGSLANGMIMTSPQSRTFVNGVLTVREVSAPNPDSLLHDFPCTDRSRFAGAGGQVSQGATGRRMTFAGVCSAVYASYSMFIDANRSLTGDHGGVEVYGLPTTPVLGHQYTIAGQVQEFYGMTEIYLPVYQVQTGIPGVPPAIPVTVRNAYRDTCEASSAGPGGTGYVPPSVVPSGEDYEGMLVRMDYVKRVVRRDFATKTTNGFHIAGESPTFADTMFCQNLQNVLGAADSLNPNYPLENMVCTITGTIYYDSGTYRICPRSTVDIIQHGYNVGVPTSPKTLSFSVYPNPARRTNLSFSLPTAAHVELGVYDVTGRKVASLWNGNMPAGQFSRAWAGRDASGKPVGAGVYFYRLKVGSEVRTVRGILLGN